MNKGGKLLVSQIEIIKNIIGLISHSPCFIVLNGEIGAGKTTICEAVITYYQKRSKKSILGYSGISSNAVQIRSGLIKGFFNSLSFDENDPLIDTCQMFDIARTDGLLVIDSVDCIDDGKFLLELYDFFDQYKQSLNISIVVSTSRLLSGLLYRDNLADVSEITIPHLNVRDKKNLLKYYLEKKLLSQFDDHDFFIGLIENCGTLPAEIVKFVENNEMSGMNFNEDDLDNNAESPKTIVPNEETPRAAKYTIEKPAGPNKTIVIAVAVVLALILIGIVSLLLKKQNVSNPEEVVVQQKPQQIMTLIENAQVNGHEDDEDDSMIENQVIDNMMSGSNDINIDAPVSAEVKHPVTSEDNIQNINKIEKDLKEQVKIVENKIDDQAKTMQQEVEKVQEQVNTVIVENKNEPSSKPADEIPIVVDNSVSNTAPTTPAVSEPVVPAKSAPEVKKDVATPKNEPKTAANNKDNKTQQVANNKDSKTQNRKETAKQDVKTAQNNTKPQNNSSLKAGEVKSFAELSNNSAKAAPVKSAAAPSAKNFVVQVACSANKGDLQAKVGKYGSNAFVYERKNNALKYVLVVGYYSNQKEASAAAKKLGNGAFAKSMAAVEKERL